MVPQSGHLHNQPASEGRASAETWREVLDAVASQDALGYLRRCCPSPQPASVLMRRLAADRRALVEDLGGMAGEARAVADEIEAFFVEVQATACAHSTLRGDAAVVWPWPDVPTAWPAPPASSLAILYDTSRQVLAELDLKRLLPLLVERAAALAEARGAFLALVDPEAAALDIIVTHGLPGVTRQRLALTRQGEVAFLSDETARLIPLSEAPSLAALFGDLGVESALLAPVVHQGTLLGLLCCAGPAERPDPQAVCDMLALLASQTTIALRNAAHYREIVTKAVELQAANEQLRSLDVMKDQFLGTISHELKTPLNFITGFGTILLEEEIGLTGEQRHFVQRMLDGGFQLLNLVNDLLDFSLVSSGKLSLCRSWWNPGEVLAATVGTYGELARTRGVELRLAPVPPLPTMLGDERRFCQVVGHLVTNALKFTPKGGVVVVDATACDKQLRVAVTDTGIGVTPFDAPRLFDRFSQLDASSTRKAGGAGLGLALSKALVTAHGGRIGVVSPTPPGEAGEAGRGSLFWFTLPLPVES